MAFLTNLIKTPISSRVGPKQLEFILNELSLSGQFTDAADFEQALDRIAEIRNILHSSGRKLKAHQSLTHAQVTPEFAMKKIVGSLPINKARAWMAWLTREGPFWDHDRKHPGDGYLDVDGQLVTDTGLGEVAWRRYEGEPAASVSFAPSDWQINPIQVRCYESQEPSWEVSVSNYWSLEPVGKALERCTPLLASWEELRQRAISECEALHFSDDCFDYIAKTPFAVGPAERLLERLRVLNRLKCCFEPDGALNTEGSSLFQKHFVGEKAWFSDSSETEKNLYRNELRFRHPTQIGEFIDASWHGKVKTPQLRIHFSWPITAAETTYVVYVGPKLTKK